MVHVQQRLVVVGYVQAVLAPVVVLECVVELGRRERAARIQIPANLGDVKVLWLIYITIRGHYDGVHKRFLTKDERRNDSRFPIFRICGGTFLYDFVLYHRRGSVRGLHAGFLIPRGAAGSTAFFKLSPRRG